MKFFSLEFSRLAIRAKTQSHPPESNCTRPGSHRPISSHAKAHRGQHSTLETPGPALMCPRTWSHQTAGQHHAQDTSVSNIRTNIAHQWLLASHEAWSRKQTRLQTNLTYQHIHSSRPAPPQKDGPHNPLWSIPRLWSSSGDQRRVLLSHMIVSYIRSLIQGQKCINLPNTYKYTWRITKWSNKRICFKKKNKVKPQKKKTKQKWRQAICPINSSR